MTTIKLFYCAMLLLNALAFAVQAQAGTADLEAPYQQLKKLETENAELRQQLRKLEQEIKELQERLEDYQAEVAADASAAQAQTD